MAETVIKIENLKKKYRLGVIGGTTLTAEIQSRWARIRGKEDPNTKLGEENVGRLGEEFFALDGINLDVKQGEAVGIIGHNGAGKSTLLKILSSVTAPTEGVVKIKGRISSMLEVGTGFHKELTGRENIYMNGAILGMSKKEVDSKIDDIIEFSECGQFIDTPVKRYSSGMYVKLAFAVAAFLDAEIMIMDEVLAVGDVKFQKKCLGKMGDSASNEGKTILYVSHNMSTIRQLCTRCIVLNHGKVIFDGGVEDAISCYMESADSEKSNYVDLREAKRPDVSFGTKFRLLSISFIDKEAAVFYSDEKMKIRIRWKTTSKLENIFLRFEVMNADLSPVGMAESVEIGEIETNHEGEWVLEWDASNLAAGDYLFNLDVYTSSEFGTFSSYDHPFRKIAFSIEDNSEDGRKCAWDRLSWNSVRLNTIELKEKY